MIARDETRVGQRASWHAALIGASPFLLFGLAHLLHGIGEFNGQYHLTFNLLDGSLNLSAMRRQDDQIDAIGVWLAAIRKMVKQDAFLD